MVDSVLVTSLKAVCLPAAITLLSAFSALFLKVSKNVESALGHFAAGVVLSACANELLPMVSGKEVGIWPLSLGFLGGMGLMMLVRKCFPEDDDDDDDDDKKEALLEAAAPSKDGGTMPWATVIPMAIDFVLDGILMGLSFAAAAGSGDDTESSEDSGPSAGLIIVISLSVEKITLGSSTTLAMIKSGVSKFTALGVVTALAASMFLGAAFGATVVASLQGTPIFYSAIAFGVASLLWLVTEELLEEAHEVKDTTMTPVYFFAGFLIPMVLDKLGGGD